MFYPVESLRRGGRFYLCWVADSWPRRFATINQRQLWSQDVRTICDDLMGVIINESGSPSIRFSLRLSSQLMRGLVRLYQKKVDIFLNDLCMVNANLEKSTNKKYKVEVRTPRPQPQVTEQQLQFILEEPESEEQIIQMILNSRNVVANIEEITLREAPTPAILQPPYDGFGEENPEQALLPCDCTVEMMLGAHDACGHHSAVELSLDLTDKSHDESYRALDTQMERISERDVTKSHGEEPMPGDFEKGFQILEIPDIPIHQDQLPLEPEIVEAQTPTVQESEDFVLEELENTESEVKRRRIKKIIFDEKTIIGGNIMRARIANPNVELRCQASSDDIVKIRVPLDVYMSRPSHAGSKIHSNLALAITRQFTRNLGVVKRSPRAERDFQYQCEARRYSERIALTLMKVHELSRNIVGRNTDKTEIMFPSQKPHSTTRSTLEAIHEVEKPPIPKLKKTQKIVITPVHAKKRKSAPEHDSTDIHRSCGTQENRHAAAAMETTGPAVMVPEITPYRIDKENIPENIQETERSVTAMLQPAGLADMQTVEPPVASQSEISGREGSDQWGTADTMTHILQLMKKEASPITVKELIAEGHVLPGNKRIMAAKCFTSILKLKQAGYITIKKCPGSSEIEDIRLGMKFD